MKKDPEASFEQLYRTNSRDLYVYIVRSVMDEGLAQDILHDTFLNFFKIYKNRPLPDPVGCRMYLFRSARNLIINQSRSGYKRTVTLVESYPEDSGSESGSPEKAMLKEQAFEEAESILRELLQSLDERSRTALILRFQENMKLEEISEVLGTSVATASRIISRAQKKLMNEGKKRNFHPDDLSGT